MNSNETKRLIESDFVRDFIDICPHCNAKAHLEMLYNDSYKEEKSRNQIYYILFRCRPCKGLVLETYKFRQNQYRHEEDLESAGWEDKFPSEEITTSKKFDGIVSDSILEDFKEGLTCLQNNCPRAAV